MFEAMDGSFVWPNATDTFSLQPPRHISTLPGAAVPAASPDRPLRAFSGKVESGFPSENATMQKCKSGFCLRSM